MRFLRAAATNAIAARSTVAGNEEGDGDRGPRRQGQLGFSFILRKVLCLLPLLLKEINSSGRFLSSKCLRIKIKNILAFSFLINLALKHV